MVQANAGTPLMLASALHLLFGNFIIGIVEGLLLAQFFKLSNLKCILLMIPANYLSAWLGGFVIAKAIATRLSMGLYSAWPLLWLMVFITYLLTLILEFPFIALAFRGRQSWFRKSIRASFLVQSISYAALVLWYWGACGTSLYTQSKVVELSSISLPERVIVYFISSKDGDVYQGSIRNHNWKKVYDLNSSQINDRLFVKASDSELNSWDLMARLETGVYSKPEILLIKKKIAAVAAPFCRSRYANYSECQGSWFNFGAIPKLGDAESSTWEFWSGFWPIEGLHGRDENSGRKVQFSLDTPFLSWSVRNATHLPTDKVLFQLGENQICIYDPETQQVALLTTGRGPIAVMMNENSIEKTVTAHSKMTRSFH